jgi:hypothetical protein
LSRVWLIGVAVFVAALVVAGIVVALVTSRDAGLLPADTPEGAVQRYLLALQDHDYREAYSYLSDDTKRACGVEDFRRFASDGELRESRMTLEDTEIFDGTAIVTARVTVFAPDIFGPSEYSYDRTFNVTLEGGQWRLDWPDFRCPPIYGRRST